MRKLQSFHCSLPIFRLNIFHISTTTTTTTSLIKHYHTNSSTIKNALEKVPSLSRRNDLKDIISCIESNIQLYYSQIETQIQNDYEEYEPQSPTEQEKEEQRKQKQGAFDYVTELMGPALLDLSKAQKLIKDFIWLCQKAGFEFVDINDEIRAWSHHFKLTTSIDINWKYFTHGLITNEVLGYDNSKITYPSFAHRVLVMKRGKKEVISSGYFFVEKINELVRRFVVGTQSLVSRFLRSLNNKTKIVEIEEDKDRTDALSQIELGIENIFSRITLREPAFDDIIILFGHSIGSSSKKPYIHIKHFQHIPISDLEFVFPSESQQVALRPMDAAFITSMGIGGIGIGAPLIFSFSSKSRIAASLAWVGLISYIIRTVLRYRASKTYCRQIANEYFSAHCIASNRSVLCNILFSARMQDISSISIVTIFLWKNERNENRILLEQLREQCIQFADELSLKSNEIFSEKNFNWIIRWLSGVKMIEIDGDYCIFPSLKEIHKLRKKIIESDFTYKSEEI